MCFLFVILGAGKLVLPSGIRELTDDEKRWFAIGCGLDQSFECVWDSEKDMLVQTNRKLNEEQEQDTVIHCADSD